jgi:hypothetical protein
MDFSKLRNSLEPVLASLIRSRNISRLDDSELMLWTYIQKLTLNDKNTKGSFHKIDILGKGKWRQDVVQWLSNGKDL